MFLTPREFYLLNDVVTTLSEAGKTILFINQFINHLKKISFIIIIIICFLFILASSYSDTSSNHTQQQHHHRSKMREMKTEDFSKVEESLQQQFTSVDSDWKSALNSLNSTDGSPNSRARANSEDEFFSMSDFPLPQLGQPTLLNTVKQCNLTGTDDLASGRFSPTSPRSTLSNISLGGSSGSLNSKCKLMISLNVSLFLIFIIFFF